MSFLKQLRAKSVERSSASADVGVFEQPICSWTVLEWAGAAAGEVGEACNIAKKIRRGDHGDVALHRALKHEIADAVIYLDLLCARVGIDLEDAIVEKFNLTSAKRGCDIVLEKSDA